MTASQRLIHWYEKAGRELPWRETTDPYSIWISEVMLQQTQVATVLPYYERWINRFPDFSSLASASEEEVLEHWSGLGYYSRARNLHLGAQQVVREGVPTSSVEWRRLKGVGSYTSNAIASIAHGESVPVVDGNVERVFARLTCCPLAGPELNKQAWNWAYENFAKDRAASWNQAIMELGATVCRPGRPICEECPLTRDCLSFSQQSQSEFPVPKPKQSLTQVSVFVSIPYKPGFVGLIKPEDTLWWKNLWQFPMVDGLPNGTYLGSVKASVTRYKITLRVFCEEAFESDGEPDNLTWFSLETLQSLGLPSPMRRVGHLFEAWILNSPASGTLSF